MNNTKTQSSANYKKPIFEISIIHQFIKKCVCVNLIKEEYARTRESDSKHLLALIHNNKKLVSMLESLALVVHTHSPL